jgi:hypothetical protein
VVSISHCALAAELRALIPTAAARITGAFPMTDRTLLFAFGGRCPELMYGGTSRPNLLSVFFVGHSLFVLSGGNVIVFRSRSFNVSIFFVLSETYLGKHSISSS